MSSAAREIYTIALTERLASVFSLIGCAFVIGTFAFSEKFRKPVNRLILYAVFGNVAYSLSTLIATAGIEEGDDSALCQTQAFLIQMFLPADVLWNLSMALNVYLTVFKHYETAQLRAREPYYHAVNYGGPFIIALVYCFVETPTNGKVYGNASIWCWISAEWSFLRIATCYGPAWLCIIAAFTIYVLAGCEILKKRSQLRSLRPSVPTGMQAARSNTNDRITAQQSSELKDLRGSARAGFPDLLKTSDARASVVPASEYSVTIKAGTARTHSSDPEMTPSRTRQRNTAMEANTAAWGYTKCCLLFFASLLVTWLPSSANRLFDLVYPTVTPPFGLSYAAAFVLPLTGFWNSVIYIFTSWGACKSLFFEDIMPLFEKKQTQSRRASAFWANTALPVSLHRRGDSGPRRPYISTVSTLEEESEESVRQSADDTLASLHFGQAR